MTFETKLHIKSGSTMQQPRINVIGNFYSFNFHAIEIHRTYIHLHTIHPLPSINFLLIRPSKIDSKIGRWSYIHEYIN